MWLSRVVAAPGPRGAGAPRKFNVAPAPLVQIGPAVIKINILTKNFLGTKHHRVLILFLEDPVPWTPSSGSQNLAPGAPEIKQGPPKMGRIKNIKPISKLKPLGPKVKYKQRYYNHTENRVLGTGA